MPGQGEETTTKKLRTSTMSGDDLYLGESGAPEVDPRMMSPVGRTDSGHKPAGYVPGARSNLQAREQLRNLSNVIAAPMGCSRRLTRASLARVQHLLQANRLPRPLALWRFRGLAPDTFGLLPLARPGTTLAQTKWQAQFALINFSLE